MYWLTSEDLKERTVLRTPVRGAAPLLAKTTAPQSLDEKAFHHDIGVMDFQLRAVKGVQDRLDVVGRVEDDSDRYLSLGTAFAHGRKVDEINEDAVVIGSRELLDGRGDGVLHVLDRMAREKAKGECLFTARDRRGTQSGTASVTEVQHPRETFVHVRVRRGSHSAEDVSFSSKGEMDEVAADVPVHST